MSVIIQIDRLSKEYRLGQIGGKRLVDDVNRWWARMRGKEDPLSKIGTVRPQVSGITPHPSNEALWALRDVSFEVNQGEVLGIIGRNGAGKSTLLKILSRVTAPTSGEIRVKGRIASLLEVGTGFHPELTGRENIFLNGAILGMTKAEIRSKFDEIVAFAEVEKFVDTPVKRYSSGMYVRLAFAVAAHLEPEILIVDEVLAVGDAEFQKKCLGKMHDVALQGRTVLFVSHNMQAVSTLTTRCALLKYGRLDSIAPTPNAIANYLQSIQIRGRVYRDDASRTKPKITYAEVQTSEPGNVHRHGMPLRVTFEITAPSPIRSASFSFQIVDSFLLPVVHLLVCDAERPMFRREGVVRVVCDIPQLRLYMGRYSITAHFAEGEGGKHFQTVEGLCPLEVVMHGLDSAWKWRPGTCRYVEDASWEVSEVKRAPINVS